MRFMFAGMMAMVDVTALFLAQAEITLAWEKHALYGLIGGTIGFVIHGCLFGLDVPHPDGQPTSKYVQEICRRSLAAIAIGVVFGPVSAQVASSWLKVDVQAFLVPASALMSMIGPYLVEKYGKRAIDAGMNRGLSLLDSHGEKLDRE